LYLIATPIGNLEDMTLRGLRLLREVDVIACEDTRHTQRLLDHFAIPTPCVSYHEHNEAARAGQLVERIENGESVAVVSDAGTPLISDPGYRVVQAALERGITVIPVPGASAVLAALAGSGLPTDAVWCGGFLPPKQGQRRKALAAWGEVEATLIFYEAPHRILETLADVAAVLGERRIVLGRELTKLHEEFVRGRVSEVLTALSQRAAQKGEMTLLISRERAPATVEAPVAEAVRQLVSEGMERMEAIKKVARDRGLAKREVYAALER
jgi:16S rRNA (cytidine1402-2'-O)-methyltransferase